MQPIRGKRSVAHINFIGIIRAAKQFRGSSFHLGKINPAKETTEHRKAEAGGGH
jgi:hypothetical protein